ncbi:IS200/IS605 family transposase [Rossellomorea aquimaris]|nr:IS200/IS605 family transposase [Rossellomorea aquimaris]
MLKRAIRAVVRPKGVTVEKWNHDDDHIHILFRSVPNIDLFKVLNTYKSVSSRFVKRDYPKIRQQLWKDMFWSRSYCLLTTGGAPIEVLKKYIQSQGEK